MTDAAWHVDVRVGDDWGMAVLRALQALHKLFVSGVDPTEKE